MSAWKRPFDIDLAMNLIREVVKPFPKAALFALADEGHRSPFEQLIACILTIRTLDEISLVCARELFGLGRTPKELAVLDTARIDAAISACRFHDTKSRIIHGIACRIMDEYGGELPCEEKVLLSFQGVGPKCTNLVLGAACGQPRISVDVHVDRVPNRWGYIHTTRPEQSLKELEKILPRKHWVDINRLLVPFGKHICTSRLPKCSTCPILDMCRQAGVAKHR